MLVQTLFLCYLVRFLKFFTPCQLPIDFLCDDSQTLHSPQIPATLFYPHLHLQTIHKTQRRSCGKWCSSSFTISAIPPLNIWSRFTKKKTKQNWLSFFPRSTSQSKFYFLPTITCSVNTLFHPQLYLQISLFIFFYSHSIRIPTLNQEEEQKLKSLTMNQSICSWIITPFNQSIERRWEKEVKAVERHM